MRPWVSTSCLLLLVLSAAVTLVADDVLPTWFDYKQCDFCKQFAAQPGLIAHTREEARNSSDGMVWFTYVDKAYREQYQKAMLGQEMVVRSLLPGQSPKACQYCNTVGQFNAKGVHMESVSGSDVDIVIYTSNDTTVVRQLQEFGVKAMAEEAKANAAFLAGK